ncbi:helix-turn-helix transcriptional regulator [Thioclava sp. BHET1]|nr:helix-turn-helix transcriptional regulator [Thioclava sp. BHET1]
MFLDQSLVSSAAPGLSPLLLDSMSQWVASLHGSGTLNMALKDIARALGAEAAMLVRSGGAAEGMHRVAAYDASADRAGSRPLVRSYARSFFGRFFAAARPASIWLASSFDAGESDPALGQFQAERGLKDFAALILSSGGKVQDHIELHFREPLDVSTTATLISIAPSAARAWTMRSKGVATRALMASTPGAGTGLGTAAILSVGNPARLSRAEFRVCLLLGRGLSVKGVSRELDLAEATVRTHLRNIYAKTGVSGLAELIHRLLEAPAEGHVVTPLRRMA